MYNYLKYYNIFKTKHSLNGRNDAQTGMHPGIPRGAMCVQRFDDSLNSAIHTTYRISLRSSSMPEPRDPLLKVLIYLFSDVHCNYRRVGVVPVGGRARRGNRRCSKCKGWYLDRGRSPNGND